jgi:hypothetical protein
MSRSRGCGLNLTTRLTDRKLGANSRRASQVSDHGIGPAPDPLPGRLAAPGLVIVEAVGDLLLVVAVLAERDLADREHL